MFYVNKNLIWFAAGKRKCVECAQQVLKVLIDLLGHDNKEVSVTIKS